MHGGTPPGFAVRGTELEEKKVLVSQVMGNGAASVTPASSSCPLPVTQHTGRDWLNAETVESCKGVRCRPARSSADVRKRATHWMRQNSEWSEPSRPGGMFTLRMVRKGNGIHYPVGQPLIGVGMQRLTGFTFNHALKRHG